MDLAKINVNFLEYENNTITSQDIWKTMGNYPLKKFCALIHIKSITKGKNTYKGS